MFAPSPILRCYEALELIARDMLGSAEAGDWSAVCELQQAYVSQVERLRHLKHDSISSESERTARLRRLERILACDAAIRNLLTPEVARLDRLLYSSRRQRELNDAYCMPT